MQGKYGTSMQGIEYRKPAKGNRKCKECKHLYFGIIGKSSCYKCEIKKQPRYYTSVCYCKNFEKK